MIKVLDKTFLILEKLALQSPRPCRIGELAEEFGLNNATCARILKELVEAGYAIHLSRLTGYTVGPRSWTFASQVRYREKLIEAAEPVIRQAASELEASVLLAERQGMERYILLHHNGCRKLDIVLGKLSFHDLFDTATGLLLTAFAPEKEQKMLVEHYWGKECNLLDPAGDPSAQLSELKSTGHCIFEKTDQGIIAWPIRQNREVTAVLGASVAVGDFVEPYRSRLIAAISRAAQQISQTISTIQTAG
ncbi:helix-turn-helix domain-containing protein [uncultured Victivallis sp.]|uniref:IclR family transcriptional regulator n=1 Tax=uncultured Victivallis sp. TaxID=354118 RepID=UPI0025D86FEC|nr:helix-turn-helix domain-containing protein [uncultured Victivallis sp.]